MSMAIGGQVVAAFSLGSQPLVYAIASEILPRKWRPEAQAGLNIALGLGAIFTLLVGLKLTNNTADGWRTMYYIATATNGVAAIVCAFLYNPLPRPLQLSLTLKAKLGKVC